VGADGGGAVRVGAAERIELRARAVHVRFGAHEQWLWTLLAAASYVGLSIWHKWLLNWIVGPMWLVAWVVLAPIVARQLGRLRR
jgi:hypothetical protein